MLVLLQVNESENNFDVIDLTQESDYQSLVTSSDESLLSSDDDKSGTSDNKSLASSNESIASNDDKSPKYAS